MKFKELGLNDQLLEAISYMGFEEATPIQELAIPVILQGKDLMACAQTGTGKTAAFTLPMIQLMAHHTGSSALILVPTRELAVQIDRQIEGFGYFSGVHSISIYGGGDGQEWDVQKNALKKGADIIVATPGKLIAHLNMGYVKFDQVKFLILDEADRMLDMGFRDDIEKIISHLPKERQNLLFSATMPSRILELSNTILRNPEEIKLSISKPAAGVLQGAYLTYDQQKTELICKLIANKDNYTSILIFSSTKRNVGNILSSLRSYKIMAEGISSDLEQKEREEILSRFRCKKTRIVVATDVLARGIDIKEINLVINYDVPNNAEDYVHRVGRTARADETGVALTLVNEKDMMNFADIEKLIGYEIRKISLPPEMGEGPSWNPKPQRSFRFAKKAGGDKKKSTNFSTKNKAKNPKKGS